MDRAKYIIGKLGVEPNASGRIHTYCPFHDDQKPSFSIHVEKGLWKCGSNKCGLSGNFAKFYKLMENIGSWREVWDKLKEVNAASAQELLDLLKDETRTKGKIVNQFPTEVEDIVFLEYLNDRSIGKEVINSYGLKFARQGYVEGVSLNSCIVAPIYDIDGEYRTFQVRYLAPGATKRWNNPFDGPIHNLLYGGWLVNGRTNSLWITEGASDVWRLFQLGEQAVGLGTKEASSGQLNRLYGLCRLYDLTPVICLDGDVPKSFILKLSNEVDAYGLNPKIVYLNPEEDPGGLSIGRFQELKCQIGKP